MAAVKKLMLFIELLGLAASHRWHLKYKNQASEMAVRHWVAQLPEHFGVNSRQYKACVK